MAYPPVVVDFKAFWVREFIYGDGPDKVMDADITRALAEVIPLFNAANLSTVAEQTVAYLYAAAHFLTINVQGAGGLSAVKRGRGVRNVSEGIQTAKSVGQVSVTYQPPPDLVAKSPVLSPFWQTDFGKRYIQMVMPGLIGNFQVVAGPGPNQFNRE